MNDQDRDLIMALAAGELGEAETVDAMRRVSADPELARELEAQRVALDALASMPDVTLTAAERTELRSALRSQLHLAPAAAPEAAPKQASRWWRPVFGLAAAAAVVAAVVILPNTLTGDDADDVALTAEANDPQTVTSDGAESLEEVAGAATEATTTTAASADAPSADAPSADLTLGADEVLALTKNQRNSAEVEDSLSSADDEGLAPLALERTTTVDGCLEELAGELPPGDLLTLGTRMEGDLDLLYVAVLGDEGVDQVLVIDLGTCSVVDSAR